MSTHNQSNPQTELNKILEIIGRIVKISADGNYIFRGECQCYPKVSSTLYRALEKVGLLNEHDVETFQCQELKYAKAYRYTQKTGDFEILTEIQHFGGKTNLLDFTTDYRIALFFPCDSSPLKDGRVILQDKNGAIKDWVKEPYNPKSRVKVQKSIFVIPPYGFIEPDLEIIISKDLKQSLLKYLEKEHQISPEIIYPDLYGFVSSQYIRWSVYEEIDNGNNRLKSGEEAETYQQKVKNYEQAIQHFTNAIDNAVQLGEGLAVAYDGRGRAYFSIGELDSPNDKLENAIEDFTEAIKYKSDYAPAYNNRGLAYFSKGNLENSKIDFDNAIADFSKAIELNSEFAPAHYNRGRTHFLQGEFTLAIRDYNTAIGLKSDRDIYYDRGIAWLHLQEWENAKADLIIARSMEFNIIDAFQDFYKNIKKCEQLIGTRLPSDIASLLTQP